jgi:hypothetical protein
LTVDPRPEDCANLEIIGAGFGRTGTMSLKLALESLGYGPCYHMIEVEKNEGHDRLWLEALSRTLPNWNLLLANYRSAVDWPAAFFWRELAEYYPSAKVILTERDDRAWYDSMRQTIFEALTQSRDKIPERVAVHRRMTTTLVLEHVFHGRFEDSSYVRSVYRDHNDRVRDEVHAERLLVFKTGDGWGPLCRFLGVDDPATAFPHANSSAEFRRQFLSNSG